jgi:hypothetical protein
MEFILELKANECAISTKAQHKNFQEYGSIPRPRTRTNQPCGHEYLEHPTTKNTTRPYDFCPPEADEGVASPLDVLKGLPRNQFAALSGLSAAGNASPSTA